MLIKKTKCNKSKLTCDICESVFCTKLQLMCHKNREHQIKSMNLKGQCKCHTCKKTFGTYDGKRNHECKSHTIGNFSCKKCSYTTYSKGNLKQHYVQAAKNKAKVYCDFCDKLFCTKNVLTRHMTKEHVYDFLLQKVRNLS